MCALQSACVDKITAPQVEALLERLETPEFQATSCYEGSPPFRGVGCVDDDLLVAFFAATPRVTVTFDGVPSRFHALVWQIAVIHEGDNQRECMGTRSFLHLRRMAENPEQLTLYGWRFDVPLSPSGFEWPCGGPTLSTSDAWESESGSASITPGVVVGPCGFLTSEAIELLTGLGFTCTITQHQVQFAASMRGPWTEPAATGRRSIALARTKIIGVRYTLDCARYRLGGRDLGMCEPWPL